MLCVQIPWIKGYVPLYQPIKLEGLGKCAICTTTLTIMCNTLAIKHLTPKHVASHHMHLQKPNALHF